MPFSRRCEQKGVNKNIWAIKKIIYLFDNQQLQKLSSSVVLSALSACKHLQALFVVAFVLLIYSSVNKKLMS